jgi:hypothetical protein
LDEAGPWADECGPTADSGVEMEADVGRGDLGCDDVAALTPAMVHRGSRRFWPPFARARNTGAVQLTYAS